MKRIILIGCVLILFFDFTFAGKKKRKIHKTEDFEVCEVLPGILEALKVGNLKTKYCPLDPNNDEFLLKPIVEVLNFVNFVHISSFENIRSHFFSLYKNGFLSSGEVENEVNDKNWRSVCRRCENFSLKLKKVEAETGSNYFKFLKKISMFNYLFYDAIRELFCPGVYEQSMDLGIWYEEVVVRERDKKYKRRENGNLFENLNNNILA